MAAPPPAKFATIWCVTSAGKADTPCAVTPCDPANTTTCTLSSFGIARPCQRASHAAISSRRPRLPCGLVNVSWRARAALAAAPSPGQRSVQAADNSLKDLKGMEKTAPDLSQCVEEL